MTARPAAGPPPHAATLARPDGTRLWYERSGRADRGATTVLLCSPGGRNAAYWSPALLAALGERAAVVRFDWRGQGRSSRGPGPTDAEDLVEDLLALADEVAPTAAVELVGVGLGAWVALRAAQRWASARPGRPRGVTAVGASAWYADPRHPGPNEPTVVALVLRRRSAPAADLVRLVGRELRAELGPAEVAALDADPAVRAAHRAEVQRWFDHGFDPDDDHRVAWLAAAPLAGGVPLSCPVRVLHGADDPVVPLAHGRRLAAALGVACEEVAASGHHVGPTLEAALLATLRDALALPDGARPSAGRAGAAE